MGMPEKPRNGMNIAPDGTVYEVLNDGSIKRIGKVSPDGSFEPFGGAKEGIREKDGILYRVINGKEVKIGRILPNGEIETINQRIRSEAEIAKSKVEIVKTISFLIAFVVVICAVLYIFNQQKSNDFNSNDNSVREAAAEVEKAKAEVEKAKQEAAAEVEKAKAEVEKAKQEADAKVKAVQADANAKVHAVQVEADTKVKAAQVEAKAKVKVAQKAQTGGGTKIGSLYWSKRSRNEMNWNAAVKYCQNLNEGGYSDWRLPTISELRTTIKNCSGSQSGGSCRVSDNCLGYNCWSSDSCSCDERANNGGYYSKLGDDDKVWLWSSSVHSDYPNLRWYVYFADGYVDDYYVGDNCYVRCVR